MGGATGLRLPSSLARGLENSARQQFKPLAGEVGVERQGGAEVEAAHQLEADVIDEGGAAAQRPQMSSGSRVVEVGVDPDELQDGSDVLEQGSHGAGTEAPVCKRLGLNQDVVVGDRLAVAKRLGHGRRNALVLGGIAVEEGKQPRCVEEDQSRRGFEIVSAR